MSHFAPNTELKVTGKRFRPWKDYYGREHHDPREGRQIIELHNGHTDEYAPEELDWKQALGLACRLLGAVLVVAWRRLRA